LKDESATGRSSRKLEAGNAVPGPVEEEKS
jgi:hypothetical protein